MIGDLDFCCYEDTNFLLHLHILAKSWAHPVTYPVDTGGSFTGGNVGGLYTRLLSWVECWG